MLWVLGLGALAIVVLVVAGVSGGIEYSLAAVVSAVIGLMLSVAVLIVWISAKWVRESVASSRLAGKQAWPVRAKSNDRPRIRLGVLEANEEALLIKVEVGDARVDWGDLSSIELLDRGGFTGMVIVIEASHAGPVELEILQSNGVARADNDSVQKCLATLRSLKTAHRESTPTVD